MKKQETIFSELVKVLNKNVGETLNINEIADYLVEKGLMLRLEGGKIYMVSLVYYKSLLKLSGYLEVKSRSPEIKVLKRIPINKKISDF